MIYEVPTHLSWQSPRHRLAAIPPSLKFLVVPQPQSGSGPHVLLQPVLGQAGVVNTGVQMKYAEGRVLQEDGRTPCSPARCRKWLFSIMSSLQTAPSCSAAGRGEGWQGRLLSSQGCQPLHPRAEGPSVNDF